MPPKRAAPRGGPRAVHVGDPFIGPALSSDRGKPCLVLDLDETLVHSSFKPVTGADYIVPVEIDGSNTDVYVLKRPWVDYFMEEMGKYYEIVVFTASLSKYADPLLDLLDVGNVIRWRLFREHCYPYQGNYVKDLTSLGRPMHKTIIIDNSPHSYAFQARSSRTGSHATASARCTPFLEDFRRRISPPTPRFQRPPSTPFNSD